MANTINFRLAFQTDKSGLTSFTNELKNVKKIVDQDWSPELKIPKAEFNEIKTSIGQIETAFGNAFNSKLGVMNLDKLNKEFKKINLTKIQQDFHKLGTTGDTVFRNLATQIMTTNTRLRSSSNLLDKMASTFANTVRWSISSAAINAFTSSINSAWSYTKELDESLNNIQIVTGKSADEMERFAKKANTAAKALGQSTTEYTNAALIYYQQGLSDKDAQARTDVTLKAANVTGQSAQEVSEQLTAVWNGYKVSAQESELYIDKLAAVAASTASDLEELSTGMSKVASAANIMGVDIDQLNAQLSTVISVTRQAPESVGTAFKTVYARMNDIQAGLDTETTLDNYTKGMASLGFNVLDANNQLRDTGDVIEEIGAKWQDLTREQQMNLAQTMAGTRQYNNLLSLFDNWDMYTQAMNTSKEAAGTLQRQQDIYMESVQAHLAQLGAAKEDLFDSFIDSDSMKGGIDALTKVLELLSDFTDAIGGGGNMLLLLGSIVTRVFNQQIASGLMFARNKVGEFALEFTQAAAKMEVVKQLQEAINTAQQQADPILAMILDDYTQIETLNVKLSEAEQAKLNTYMQQQAALGEIYGTEKLRYEAASKNVSKIFDPKGTKNYSNTESLEQLDNLRTQGSYMADNKALAIQAQSMRDTQGTHAQGGHITNLKRNIAAMKEYAAQAKAAGVDITVFNSKIRVLETSLKKSNDNAGAMKKTVNQAKDAQQAFNKVVSQTNARLNELETELTESEKAMQKAQTQMQKGHDGFKEWLPAKETQAKTQSLVTAAGAVQQLTFAFSSLKNLGNIWSDESLGTGEKVLQTITALTMAIPMLIGGWKALTGVIQTNSAITGINTAIKTANTGAEMANISATGIRGFALKMATRHVQKDSAALNKNTKEKIANTAATIASNIYLLIAVAIIAAVTAAVAGLTAAYNANAKAAEDATEHAKTTAEAYNQAKESYKSLKDEIVDYEDMKAALDELTVGTEEWVEKLNELRDTTAEIIQKYPELLALGENGRYKFLDEQGLITDEGLDEIDKISKDRLSAIRDSNQLMRNRATNLQFISDQTDLRRNLDRDNDQWSKAETLGTIGLLSGITAPIASMFWAGKGIRNMANLSEDQMDLLLAKVSQNPAILEDRNALSEFLDISNSDLLDTIEENSDEIRKLAETNRQLEETNRQYYNTVAQDHLNSLGLFEDNYFASENMALVGAIYGSLIEQEAKKIQAEWDSSADHKYLGYKDENKLHQWYKNEIGAMSVEDKGSGTKGSTAIFKMADGSTIELSNEELIQLKAQAEAAEKNEAKINDLLIAIRDSQNYLGTAANFVLSAAGGASFNADKLTQADFDQLKNKGFNKATSANEMAQAFGLTTDQFYTVFGIDPEDSASFAAFREKWIAALENDGDFQKSLDKIVEQSYDSKNIEEYFKNFKNVNLEGLRDMSNALNQAYTRFGVDGATQLKQIFNGLSEDQVDDFANILNAIDWTAADSIEQLKDGLEKAGIAIDEASPAWQSFIKDLEFASNNLDNYNKQLKELRSTLETISKVSSKLKIGEEIDDAAYESLVKLNSAVKDYFVQTATGYQLVATTVGDKSITDLLYENVDAAEITQKARQGKAAVEFAAGYNINGRNLGDAKNWSAQLATDEYLNNIDWLLTGAGQSLLNNELFMSTVGLSVDEMMEARKNWWSDPEGGRETLNKVMSAMSGMIGEYDIGKFDPEAAKAMLVNQRETTLAGWRDALLKGEIDYDNYVKSLEANAKEEAELLGLSGEAIKEHALVLNASSDAFNNYAGSAYNAALAIARQTKALEDAAPTWYNTYAQLTGGDPADTAEGLVEYRKLMTGLFGEDVANNTEFLMDQATLDLMNRVMAGDSDAYQELAQNAALQASGKRGIFKDFLTTLGADAENFVAGETTLQDLFKGRENQLQYYLRSGGDAVGSALSMVGWELVKDEETGELNAIYRGLSDIVDAAKLAEDRFEAIYDRYHDINKEAERLNRIMEDINRTAEHLAPEAAATYALQQADAIAKQRINEQNRLDEQRAEQAEKRTRLQDEFGVEFDKYGNYNYKAVMEMAAGLTTEKYDILKELLSDYDALDNDIADTVATIADSWYEEIGYRTDKFILPIQARIGKESFESEWNEFLQSITDDHSAEGLVKLFELQGAAAEKLAVSAQEALNDYQDFNINDYGEDTDNDGILDTYDTAKAMEDFQAIVDNLKNSATAAKEMLDSSLEQYKSALDEVDATYSSIQSAYDRLNGFFEHGKNLTELLYGDKAYDKMSSFYASMTENAKHSYALTVNEQEYWASVMQSITDTTSEEYLHAQEKYNEALVEGTETLESTISAIIDEYVNAINVIIEELNQKVTGGLGLDYIGAEWDYINDNADTYLSNLSGIIEMTKLEQKFQAVIDNTDDLKTQQKLKKVQEEQLKILREKDKLTQYDIERANLQYELALKQMALEDARDSKSQMRLTRDASGNYTYKFVSDEDKIAEAQQELLEVQNELYNLDLEEYTNNLDEVYKIYSDYQEKMIEISQIKDEEERTKQISLLRTQTEEKLFALTGRNATILNNLYGSVAETLTTLGNETMNNVLLQYGSIEQYAKETIPALSSSIQDMVNTFSADGFTKDFDAAWEKITLAAKDATDNFKDLNINVEDMDNYLDNITSNTTSWIDTLNNQKLSFFADQAQEAKGLLDSVQSLLKDSALLVALYNGSVTPEEVYAKISSIGKTTSTTVTGTADVSGLNQTPSVGATSGSYNWDVSAEGNIIEDSSQDITKSDIQNNATNLTMDNEASNVQQVKALVTEVLDPWKAYRNASLYDIVDNQNIYDVWANLFNKLYAGSFQFDDEILQLANTEGYINDEDLAIIKELQAVANSEIGKVYLQFLFDLQNARRAATQKYGSAELIPYLGDTQNQKKISQTGQYLARKGGQVVSKTTKPVSEYLDSLFYDASSSSWDRLKQLGYDVSTALPFATGGYTGAWGDAGKLAVLHEKELVLNKTDTANILNAVELMRTTFGTDLLANLHNALAERIAAITATIGIPSLYETTNTPQTVEQKVEITAEFPGVSAAQEIEDAFTSLINLSAQRANTTKR